jgi:hypothetical protein
MRMPRVRSSRRWLLTWIAFGGAIVGGATVIAGASNWSTKCKREGNRCEEAAIYWEKAADDYQKLGDAYARSIERPTRADASWYRRRSAEDYYLSRSARRIAGLYRDRAERWRGWRAPDDPTEPSSTFISPEESELSEFIPR